MTQNRSPKWTLDPLNTLYYYTVLYVIRRQKCRLKLYVNNREKTKIINAIKMFTY